MIKIERILCPTDFSDFARRGFEHAVAFAKWYGARVGVMHAMPVLIGAPGGELPVVLPMGLPERQEEVERELQAFVKGAAAEGVPVEVWVDRGPAVAAILERARSWPADLLVMGTHGLSGFERMLLGSTTEKVLRKAACPVLTVPRQAPGLSAGPLVFKNVLCPVDFSPASLKALEYSMSLGQEAGGQLVVMHVLEGLPDEESLASEPFDLPGLRARREEAARARIAELVPETVRDWCEPRIIVSSGKAYREILRAASEERADLIVMGVLGRNALDLTVFGSTTQHVVRGASCPVLTIRASGGA